MKSLLIQSENDDGDLAEMRDGVIRGLRLSPEEAKLACDNVVVFCEDGKISMEFTSGVLEPLLEAHQPDLVWIDPALAYLGGDASSQKDVGGFLRRLITPLIRNYECGCVIIHHTNKPANGREKPEYQAGDFAYLGSGSSEWANWARAVLVVRSIGSHSVFELRAAKRGNRLGWTEADGKTRSYIKVIAHAKEPGVICWREAEPSEAPEPAPQKKKCQPTKESILSHVPPAGAIEKNALKNKANRSGVSYHAFGGLLNQLISEGTVYEWQKKRSGTNPQKLIARQPQPPEVLL